MSWFKLHRTLKNHPLWLSEPFTRGQAWVDMIMLANFRPGHVVIRGNRVNINRGQLGWSEVALADRWRWSRGKVRRFLKMLENDRQIVQQKNAVTSVITIVNYDLYQADGTADGTADGQQTDSRRYSKKKNKNPPISPQGDFVRGQGMSEELAAELEIAKQHRKDSGNGQAEDQ